MILLAALLLQDMQVLAHGPIAPAGPPPVAANLSLVIADTVEQVDPQPLCAQANCTSLFLGTFRHGHVLAGQAMPAMFAARLEMGSPFLSRYRLALIVEQRPDAEPLVRAQAGFNVRTGVACFEPADVRSLGWTPSGAGISVKGDLICVKE